MPLTCWIEVEMERGHDREIHRATAAQNSRVTMRLRRPLSLVNLSYTLFSLSMDTPIRISILLIFITSGQRFHDNVYTYSTCDEFSHRRLYHR